MNNKETTQRTQTKMVSLEELQDLKVPSTILLPESPEMRNSIIKTCMYIINNGDTFETKLLKTQENNQNFLFLQEGNIYHEYYKYLKNSYVHANLASTPSGLMEDPLNFSFTSHKDHQITPVDLKIIKLTALACSLYDYDSTYENLKMKYEDNPQFDFLYDEHSLYPVFKQLCHQYQLVLDENRKADILNEFGSLNWKESFLEKCYLKSRYNEYLQDQELKTNKFNTLYKSRFSAIDWNKFRIIGKFESSTTEPKMALDFNKLKKSLLLSSQVKLLEEYFDFKNVQTEKVSAKKKKNKKKNMVIKAAGETRNSQQKRSASSVDDSNSDFIQCPLTGQMIKEQDFDNHIKALLQNPNHASEKKKYQEQHLLSNLTDHEVYENIKKLTSNKKSKV